MDEPQARSRKTYDKFHESRGLQAISAALRQAAASGVAEEGSDQLQPYIPVSVVQKYLPQEHVMALEQGQRLQLQDVDRQHKRRRTASAVQGHPGHQTAAVTEEAPRDSGSGDSCKLSDPVLTSPREERSGSPGSSKDAGEEGSSGVDASMSSEASEGCEDPALSSTDSEVWEQEVNGAAGRSEGGSLPGPSSGPVAQPSSGAVARALKALLELQEDLESQLAEALQDPVVIVKHATAGLDGRWGAGADPGPQGHDVSTAQPQSCAFPSPADRRVWDGLSELAREALMDRSCQAAARVVQLLRSVLLLSSEVLASGRTNMAAVRVLDRLRGTAPHQLLQCAPGSGTGGSRAVLAAGVDTPLWRAVAGHNTSAVGLATAVLAEVAREEVGQGQQQEASEEEGGERADAGHTVQMRTPSQLRCWAQSLLDPDGVLHHLHTSPASAAPLCHCPYTLRAFDSLHSRDVPAGSPSASGSMAAGQPTAPPAASSGLTTTIDSFWQLLQQAASDATPANRAPVLRLQEVVSRLFEDDTGADPSAPAMRDSES